ncbi:hypothetical protein [Spiroplasma ixodetis]|uniref:hypothetical protein n=1 Tax=Spiroplasma ixodetis TaxID=2141 RepID=UPI0025751561|nr:hypothetical protein [Spiroplasma ixodetis]WJG69964.1 hypothetical protein SIXOD_v1c09630 [Spiroplasma ixodetis Y32]
MIIYTSFSKIFTGREAIQAVWDHSYYPIQDKDNPDLAYKQLQIGDVFYGNILSDQLGITYSATPANNAFIQEQAIKNVVINIPNEKKNFDFINNIVSNLYKLYMIPEINKVINIDKSIKVDRQWYILEVASKTYNNENKELAYIQCTFSSLNDKLAHSGLAINQYVQLGAPGDPVALPALDENNNIVLDSNYLTPLPVTHWLYAVSINEPLTENNIDNLYIINNYSQPYQNPKTRSTKSITIIKIKDFKTRDGYPIIIKLQKPLEKDTKVAGLKIKAPRSMIFGNIKVLGEVDNMWKYTQSYSLKIR